MVVTSKFVRVLLWSAAIMLAVPLVLSVLYFFHGSFETFPTEEQHGEARIAAAVVFVIFASIESGVLVGLWRLKSRIM
jgi:hypothetical protein